MTLYSKLCLIGKGAAMAVCAIGFVSFAAFSYKETRPAVVAEQPAEPVVLIGAETEMQTSPFEECPLIRAIVKTESGGNQRAVSRKGAIGRAQLMPATARELHVNPRDAKDNVRGGCKYISKLVKHYDGDETLALAAYNFGPGAVDRWLRRGGKIGQLPKETREYIAKVHLNAAVESWQVAQE